MIWTILIYLAIGAWIASCNYFYRVNRDITDSAEVGTFFSLLFIWAILLAYGITVKLIRFFAK